jgi:pyruvate,water dikinase
VDVGAALSHAVIVSRELGIPCVVSATGATRSIPDRARVRVDGTAGVVTLL